MDVVDHTGEMFSEIVRLIEALTEEINSAAAASEELSAGAEEISADRRAVCFGSADGRFSS